MRSRAGSRIRKPNSRSPSVGRAQRLAKAALADRQDLRARPDVSIEALGAGSDYTPFLQHVGITSLNISYGGEDDGGSCHSVYDSFDHYTRFGDPNFEYGLTLVRTCGRVVLRLTDADVLPYEFSNFAKALGKYVKEVNKLAEELRIETAETNRLITDRVLVAWADPKQPFVEPLPKPEVPYLNFAPLQNALVMLRQSAEKFETTRSDVTTAPNSCGVGLVRRLQLASQSYAGTLFVGRAHAAEFIQRLGNQVEQLFQPFHVLNDADREQFERILALREPLRDRSPELVGAYLRCRSLVPFSGPRTKQD